MNEARRASREPAPPRGVPGGAPTSRGIAPRPALRLHLAVTSDPGFQARVRGCLLVLALTLGFFAAGSPGGPEGSQPELDHLFSRWNRPDAAGIAVVITHEGKVVRRVTHGLADLEHRIPVGPDTVFDAASVAKQFAGLAIAMLVEQGRISLADDVRQHLPEVPDFGTPIRLDHLVHHTSGLRDWPETLFLSGRSWADRIDMPVILEMLARQRDLDFPPGTKYGYSNTGYNLLALVVEKVTGLSFSEWTRRHIFEPLGMRNTRFVDDPDEILIGRAESYTPEGGKWTRVPSRLAAVGSSSLFTTIDDMGRWLLNLESGEVGGRAAIEAMGRPGATLSGGSTDYGFGLAVGRHRDMRVLNHTGGWAGYRSVVYHLPERRFGIAILSNAGRVDTIDLARRITDLYFPPESGDSDVKPQQDTRRGAAGGPEAEDGDRSSPDPSRWDDYTGFFRLGPGWILHITRDGDRMFTRATGEDRFPMRPVTATRFFVEGYGSAITFVRGSDGKVNELRYRGIVAPRVQPPSVDEGDLEKFEGAYWSDELRVVVLVERREGELRAWHPSRGWSVLAPVEPDQFEGNGRFSVAFDRDESGRVQGLRISASRVRNLVFRKVALGAPAEARAAASSR